MHALAGVLLQPLLQFANLLPSLTECPSSRPYQSGRFAVCGLPSAGVRNGKRRSTTGDLEAQAAVDENQDQVPESSLQVRKWSVLGLSLGASFPKLAFNLGGWFESS